MTPKENRLLHLLWEIKCVIGDDTPHLRWMRERIESALCLEVEYQVQSYEGDGWAEICQEFCPDIAIQEAKEWLADMGKYGEHRFRLLADGIIVQDDFKVIVEDQS
jgi:hypothetical protein